LSQVFSLTPILI